MDAIKRLRDEQLLCRCIILFAQSNSLDSAKPFYNKSLSLALLEPTDNLLVLSSLTLAMIEGIYTQDIGFKKCGVILTCLEPNAGHVYDIFTDMPSIKLGDALMDSMEEIYSRYGKNKLALGASMFPNRRWNMSRDRLTQNYFHWDQLLKIK
ncbi:DUF4113 domain-containing protein [Acinetobacter pecorum]